MKVFPSCQLSFGPKKLSETFYYYPPFYFSKLKKEKTKRYDSPKFQAKASLEEVQGYQNWNIEEGEEEAKEEGWEKGGEESREEKDQKVKERFYYELHEVISSIISFPVMLKVYDAMIGRHTSYLGMLSLPTGKI